ncbi:MAG: hypothetical protein ACBR14_08930 [Microcoleus sp.]
MNERYQGFQAIVDTNGAWSIASQFPIPNSQFPIPNSQFPIPNDFGQYQSTICNVEPY